MNARWVLLLVLLVATGTARAQVMATGPDVVHHEPHRHGDVGVASTLSIGFATSPGVADATSYRLENFIGILYPHFQSGAYAGFTTGGSYWRSGPGTWGSDLSAQLVVGFRGWLPQLPIRGQIGLGSNVVMLDRYMGDTGFGMYAPLASLAIGFDFQYVAVVVDTRITQRWLVGADDHTQVVTSIGLVISD